jgi:hypothetical protein
VAKKKHNRTRVKGYFTLPWHNELRAKKGIKDTSALQKELERIRGELAARPAEDPVRKELEHLLGGLLSAKEDAEAEEAAARALDAVRGMAKNDAGRRDWWDKLAALLAELLAELCVCRHRRAGGFTLEFGQLPLGGSDLLTAGQQMTVWITTDKNAYIAFVGWFADTNDPPNWTQIPAFALGPASNGTYPWISAFQAPIAGEYQLTVVGMYCPQNGGINVQTISAWFASS